MVPLDEAPARDGSIREADGTEVRIRILLPLDRATEAQLLIAIAQAFPGAAVEPASAQERASHGDLLVVRVPQP
jgi:hypothetical protein